MHINGTDIYECVRCGAECLNFWELLGLGGGMCARLSCVLIVLIASEPFYQHTSMYYFIDYIELTYSLNGYYLVEF